VAGGQEEVPQAALAGLRLELLDERERLPGVTGAPRLGQVAVVGVLGRLDLLGEERADALGEIGGAGRGGEVHASDRSRAVG
jgi:hypothetical protein